VSFGTAFIAGAYSARGSDGPPLGSARQPEPSAFVLNEPSCNYFQRA